MNYFFDGVIVVEGKNDVSFLSSFISSYYVTTNGYEIPKDDLLFIQEVSKHKRTIVLTDSDDAGEEIRHRIHIDGLINVHVDLSKCNKNGKHGVAECEKEEVLRVLKPYINSKPFNVNNRIEPYELINLGLNKKEKRLYLSSLFPVGYCNVIQLAKRLSLLNISLHDIMKAMEEDK